MDRVPHLRLLCEGWDKHTCRGRSSGIERWNPTSRQKRARYGAPRFCFGERLSELGWGFAPSLSTHVRWCERGAPRQSCVGGRVNAQARFHPPVGRQSRWSTLRRAAHVVLASIAKWEIRVRSGPNEHEQTREGPHGSADSFPTHICGWVRVLTAVHFTLNLPSGKSFARDDKVVAVRGLLFHGKSALIPQQLCHLDRSAAQWRDLRFPLPVARPFPGCRLPGIAFAEPGQPF